jgi:hypothetical protein
MRRFHDVKLRFFLTTLICCKQNDIVIIIMALFNSDHYICAIILKIDLRDLKIEQTNNS